MIESDAFGTQTAAFAELARLADAAAHQSTGENFPVALRVIPRVPRERLQRLYSYARFVDDVGDEARGDRSALLDLVEEDVRRLPTGAARLRPVAGLAPLVAECGLPQQPLLDLVEANRRDQRITRYETFDDLIGYCDLSAAPVGRMVLAVAGVSGADETRWSDSICNALQVLEHCQDVAEDARAGRVYLPAAELRAAGVTDDQLTASSTAPALRRVVAAQVDRAEAMLRAGGPLPKALHGWARLAVTGFVAGGVATVAALRAADHDVLGRAVRPTKVRTVLAAARLLVR